MKCKIRGQNLRVVSKAVRVISKIAESVIITTWDYGIKLQAVNESKTAFIELDLQTNFFENYDNTMAAKCKLFVKSLILVFRLVNIDKYVDECVIIMDNSMPTIAFKMTCFKGVKREYFLPYMDCERLRYSSSLTTESVPAIITYSKVLSEALQLFAAITKEITIRVLQDRIKFRTYLEEDEQLDPMMPNTSFEYLSREFTTYHFTEPKILSFNLKDLKAFIELTTYQNQMVNVFIESSGKPITLTANNTAQYYRMKLILATFDIPYAINESQTGELVSHNSFDLETSDITSSHRTNTNPNTNVNNENNYNMEQSNMNASNQQSGRISEPIVENLQPTSSRNYSNDRYVSNQLSGRISEPMVEKPSSSRNNSNDRSINRTNLFLNSFQKDTTITDDDNEDEDEWNEMLEGILDSNETERNEVNRLTASQLAKYQKQFLFGTDDDDNDSPSNHDIIVPASDDEDSQ